MKMKVYIAGPMSGHSADTVFTRFTETERRLQHLGYTVLNPLSNKSELLEHPEEDLLNSGYTAPVMTCHAIYGRDHWMVEQADIVLADLTLGEGKVSIGTMFELAWASHLHKHIVVVTQPDNIHNHCFVKEAAHIVFETLDEAVTYLNNLYLGGG